MIEMNVNIMGGAASDNKKLDWDLSYIISCTVQNPVIG
jgi:hypothetical protein